MDIIVRRTLEPEAAVPRKMLIATEDGSTSVEVPFAPRNIEYGARGRTYSQIERPGRTPILAVGGVPLPTMKFDLVLAYADPDRDVEATVTALERIAASESRVVVTFGPAEGGLWRLSDFTYASVQRHRETQAITQATAAVELTRASDFAARVGPVTGGAVSSGIPAAPAAPASSGGTATYMGGVVYTVKRGDTLGKISSRFYRTPSRWRKIADANRIRKPKRSKKLNPGRRLNIPRVKR